MSESSEQEKRMTEITINAKDGDQLAEAVVQEAARQMLNRYVLDEDGGTAQVPSELARQIRDEVVQTIKEQAREAAPIVAAEILETGVQQTDTWGDPRGGVRSLKVVVAEEVKKNLTHTSGARGEGVLNLLIRDEVQKVIRDDLNEAVSEAREVVVKAVREEASKAISSALEKAIPFP